MQVFRLRREHIKRFRDLDAHIHRIFLVNESGFVALTVVILKLRDRLNGDAAVLLLEVFQITLGGFRHANGQNLAH